MSRLFNRLDADGGGELDSDEIREVVGLYQVLPYIPSMLLLHLP